MVSQLVLALAPLPILGLLIELIPLEPPSNGWQRCPQFLLRTWLQMVCFSIATNLFAQEHVHEIQLPRLQLAQLSMCQATLFVATLVALATATGVFPVPFSFLIVLMLFFIGSWRLRMLFLRHVLYNPQDPEGAAGIRVRFAGLMKFSKVLPVVLISDTAYTALFSRVGSTYQLLLSVLLPILKVTTKNVLWKRIREVSPDGNDQGIEVVITFGYYFHALFMAMCIKTGKSVPVLLLIIGWNVGHDVMSIYMVKRKVQNEQRLWHRLSTSDQLGRSRRRVIKDLAAWFVGQHKVSPSVVGSSSTGAFITSTFHRYNCLATSSAEDAELSPVTPVVPVTTAMLQWMNEVTQGESLLMRLYVDIFVVVNYLFLAATIPITPNRQYAVNMQHVVLDSVPLLLRFGLQLVVKFLTTWGLLHMLSQHMGRSEGGGKGDCPQQDGEPPIGPPVAATARANGGGSDVNLPSGLEQISFVIATQRRSFVAKLLVVAVYVVNFQLAHFGNDITLEFPWLRHNPPPMNETTSA